MIPKKRLPHALALAALTALPAAAQLDTGLIAYWPFDGDLQDATATGAHGTADLGSSVTPELFYASCKFGDGVYLNNFLDGSQENQFIEILSVPENTFDFAGGSMSVSFWVKESYFLGAGRTFIGKGSGESWRLEWSGTDEFTATPAMFGGLGSTAATGDGTDIAQVVDVAVHHIVGVVEAGVGIRLYFDGQLIATASGSPQLGDSEAPLTIGASPGSPATFSEGIIDDLGIWDRALSSAEVALLWNGGSGVSIAEALNPTDSDNDGMPDFYEDTNGLDKTSAADAGQGANDGLFDNDGLTNLEEFNLGTNPQVADTDDDGLTDGEEVHATVNTFDTTPADSSPDATDPLNKDSDQDGLTDGEEANGSKNIFYGSAPTDPNVPDTDGDGATDRQETDASYDPNNAASTPPPFLLGLRGYWPFENHLFDSSGQGHHGTQLGTGSAIFQDGKTGFGKCLLNDGRSPNNTGQGQIGPGQSIQLQNSEDDFDFPGGSVTVSAWVRLYSIQTPAPPTIVGKGTGNNWRLAIDGSNQPSYEGGTSSAISGGGSIAGPFWRHVVAVSEAGVGTRLYLDGLLVALGDAPMLGSNGLPLQIGGNPEIPDNTFYGLIDEVAVWSRAMDAGEVRRLWNDGEGALVPFLIAGIDGDGDGMSDVYENAHGLNPALNDAGLDSDGDTLSNLAEHDAGSDPGNPDTDGDGLRDDAEIAAGTSTLTPDSDGDGITDGEELVEGADGYITNPLKADSDDDGWSDSDEILCGSDPNDADDSCPLPYPVAYWPLDEVVGLTTPDAARDHDFSLVNLDESDLIEGRFGRAFAFSNAAQTMLTHIGGGTSLLPVTQHPAYTISLWIDAVGPGQNDLRFFSEGSTSTNDPLFNIGTANNGSNGSVDLYLRNGGSPNHEHSTVQPFNGQGWRHVAVVVDANAQTVTVFIDGERDTRNFTYHDVRSAAMNTTSVGGILRGAPSHWATGNIDDVAVWSAALTAEQIKAIADGNINPLGESLVAPPGPGGVLITSVSFNGVPVEVSVQGMDPTVSYVLRRSEDGQSFSEVGTSFTGADTNVFVDPAPPADGALYQIWTAE